jgi:hypothetical protein
MEPPLQRERSRTTGHSSLSGGVGGGGVTRVDTRSLTGPLVYTQHTLVLSDLLHSARPGGVPTDGIPT